MIFDPYDSEYQTIVEEIQSLGVPWWIADIDTFQTTVVWIYTVDGTRLRASRLPQDIALKGDSLKAHVGMSIAVIRCSEHSTQQAAAKVLRMALNRWFESQLEKVAVL